MHRVTKLVGMALIAGATGMAPVSSHASGAYSCCFRDNAGARFTYRGRASSLYKGSIERLCRTVAIEKKVTPCDSRVTDMAADLDFTAATMPAEFDLSRACKNYPCKIGVLLKGEQDGGSKPDGGLQLAVSNAGLVCSVELQIAGPVGGWVLDIAKARDDARPPKTGAGCHIYRLDGDKLLGTTRFEFGPLGR